MSSFDLNGDGLGIGSAEWYRLDQGRAYPDFLGRQDAERLVGGRAVVPGSESVESALEASKR